MNGVGWKAALGSFVLGLAMTALAGGAAAQSCPNIRATYVPPDVEQTSDGERCGIGVLVFGLEISIFGPWCPSHRFIVPGHGECNGDTAPGHECYLRDRIDIVWERCECEKLSALGVGLTLPGCECEVLPYSGGTVEDWGTRECEKR